ncbi:patatin-like phospholipase family protein [Gloeobacter morelensis]|uniref:Patatin-like phospholipase family protein n=1 Tax=Gloeobacter morelensis MG652769 TaxID=2781736 RepID=A0ABY3PQB7_9CYAN|nr:patatin-like phospholipase family protein [Gloeobacter morelensis]UFP95815.1 patatin-like phospholipase family protein [Gloeobacter morelensis MG652769]
MCQWIRAFGIFEGGGAKGLAHIAALKQAEVLGIEFVGVAGASAGSIVAALAAAGYTADELFHPNRLGTLLDINFTDFFQPDWPRLKKLTRHLRESFGDQNAFRTWLSLHNLYLDHWELLNRLYDECGLFDTENFRDWFGGLLERSRLRNRDATFADAPIRLKIIATDHERREIVVFGREETPGVSIVDAVCASISIPFFFKPFVIEHPPGIHRKLVDGGVVSNCPAWVFDDRARDDVGLPTFGFRLLDPPSNRSVVPLLQLAGDLLLTGLTASQELQFRRVDNLYIDSVKCTSGTFDFDLDSGAKRRLYKEGLKVGYGALFRYLKAPAQLAEACRQLREELGNPNLHLRLALYLPVGRERMRAAYSHNMEEDPDYRLEVSMSRSGFAECWKASPRECFYLDYTAALPPFKRPGIRSGLLVPILDPDSRYKRLDVRARPLVGIAEFDSDAELTETFFRERIDKEALKAIETVADVLFEEN